MPEPPRTQWPRSPITAVALVVALAAAPAAAQAVADADARDVQAYRLTMPNFGS